MSNGAIEKSAKNILLSFLSQTITMAFSLIVPRLFITVFGSEVNGFFSTVTQLYSYLEILRAGVGMAAIQALYGPIVQKDESQISKIISTSKKYFNKLGFVYLGATAILAIGFMLFGNVNLNKYDVLLIVIMQGVAGWLSFAQINWFVDLLRAEGKNYIFVAIQMTGIILTRIAEIILIYKTQNPVLVKSASLFFIFLEYIAFVIYRKKYYNRFNFNDETNMSLLKNRKSYLTFHISSLICTNTDIVILTLFCGYQISSVYSVYFLIVSGVNAIINTVYSSTAFLLGHSYQRGIDVFRKTHDTYYLVYLTLTTALFSVCYVLMIPFIELYTLDVQDVNYIYKYLPLLFCVIQILTCGKNVGDITINVGGLAKKVVWRAILEATINLVVSLVMVRFAGIYGVLIGTIIALSYRMIDILIFSNRNVLRRSPTKNLFMLITNLLLFLLIVIINRRFTFIIVSYWQFFKYALIISPIILILFFAVEFLLFRTESKLIIKLSQKKLNRNQEPFY